jgi:dipeptidyl aminopeptidase/acylaminoacyl peptidase
MNRIFLLIFFLLSEDAVSQVTYQNLSESKKPSLDLHILGKFGSVGSPVVSNDGKYFLYTIDNYPIDKSTLIVQSIDDSIIKKSIVFSDKGANGFFTDKNKVIYKIKDTLAFLSMETGFTNYITDVSSYKIPRDNKGGLLAYKTISGKKLCLINLLNDTTYSVENVNEYHFSDKGRVLIFITRDKSLDVQIKVIKAGKIMTIWTSNKYNIYNPIVNGLDFDDKENQLVFSVKEKREGIVKQTIWHYSFDMNECIELVNENSEGIDKGLIINGSPKFSKNGRWVFFSLKRPRDSIKIEQNNVKVDVWSYKDMILLPEQLTLLKDEVGKSFMAVIGAEGGNVIRIQQEDEELKTKVDEVTGNYVVVGSSYIDSWSWWKLTKRPVFNIVSLFDGSRKVIKAKDKGLYNFSFSPKGDYLVYFDSDEKSFFSYNTTTGKALNITKAIPTSVAYDYINGTIPRAVDMVAGWENDNSSLLIYDNFDIWKIDPKLLKSPINITNGYGKRQGIKFRILTPNNAYVKYNSDVDSLIVIAFNVRNKHNGFFKIGLNGVCNPEKLSLGPYLYYILKSQTDATLGMLPLKAKKANVWIVKRQTSNDAPNFYFTKDFKSFKNITNFQPQKKYNWLTTELIKWKMLDNRISHGILYKPEDFDPNKKYPIIFNYYERLSHKLYEYPHAGLVSNDINIPWFVSNGYLVFTPDIYYGISAKTGKVVGEYAYNSIISAVSYLSNLPYIDTKKMAIQGHSFGGLETSYLVTHTNNVFAAAAESAGSTDPISAYLSLAPTMGSFPEEINSKQDLIENAHELYGATPWERPDLYNKNSAVLSADKVTSPLLIVHNKRDDNIPWRQGLEMYLALRRLGKSVWMLQYEEGAHSVMWEKDCIDYTVRLTQFFDHYLKEKLAPKWMTRSNDDLLSSKESGMGIDKIGKCSSNCQVCNLSVSIKRTK